MSWRLRRIPPLCNRLALLHTVIGARFPRHTKPISIWCPAARAATRLSAELCVPCSPARLRCERRWTLGAIGDALALAGAMTWEILWALILGFLLSAVVQAVVREATIVWVLGGAPDRS